MPINLSSFPKQQTFDSMYNYTICKEKIGFCMQFTGEVTSVVVEINMIGLY